jgi:tetratricopeptide (TPR) repeat protein
LAVSYLNQGDTENAEKLWREGAEGQDSRIGIIRALLARRDLAGAEQEARNLIEADDSQSRGYEELGLVLQAAGRNEEAAQAYRQALERAPDSTFALQGLVAALIRADDSDGAIEYLRGYIEEYPARPDARLLLANAYDAAGDRTSAERLYEALIAEQALGARPYLRLAALYEAGTPARIDVMKRGVAAFPDERRLGLFLGQEYQQSGQVEMAIETYEAALVANGSDDLLVNNLAALLLDSRDDPESFARALDIAKRFSDSREAPYLDTLGWAYYHNADYVNAVRHLEAAVSMAGQIPVLRYHLGMAYLASGDSVNARQELERAVSTAKKGFPGLDEAKAALAELQSDS